MSISQWANSSRDVYYFILFPFFRLQNCWKFVVQTNFVSRFQATGDSPHVSTHLEAYQESDASVVTLGNYRTPYRSSRLFNQYLYLDPLDFFTPHILSAIPARFSCSPNGWLIFPSSTQLETLHSSTSPLVFPSPLRVTGDDSMGEGKWKIL